MSARARPKAEAMVTSVNSCDSGSSLRLNPVLGVLDILDRAAMTGTIKLGLLLTLLDLAPTLSGDARSIPRAALAERYLEIHWEHARPYNGVTLRQNSSRKKRKDGTVADDTLVMQEIRRLREVLKDNGRGDLQDKPLQMVRRVLEGSEWHLQWQEELDTALARVQVALLKNPVRLLQVLPGKPDPFLYDLAEDRSGLQLRPGVAESLTRFAGVLRPLIEFRFAQAVMRINRETLELPIDDVYSHLFDRERIMPPVKMRQELARIQRERCILTGRSLAATGRSLDHVLPWSRARFSQVENFLMTTPSVKSKKSDSLLAPAALERWLRYLKENSEKIRKCAQAHNWPTDIDRVRSVTLNTYQAIDATTGVWDSESGIGPLGEKGRLEALRLLR